MKRELLIDCHTGNRDLPALRMASCLPDMEICALTACYDPDRLGAETQDLEALCRKAGLRAECAVGARRPMIPRRPCSGGPGPSAEYAHIPENGYAWDLICRKAMAAPDGLTVLLLGPATNLAIALLRYPALREHIRGVILAGGSFGFGDVRPYAERSVFEDAYACKVLLRSGIPVSMIGLSAAADAALTRKELETALRPLVGEELPGCLRDLSVHRLGDRYVIPSLAAAAWMLDPAAAVTDHFHVEVEVDGTEMYGRTVIEWRHYLHQPEEALVATSVRKEALLALMAQCAD